MASPGRIGHAKVAGHARIECRGRGGRDKTARQPAVESPAKPAPRDRAGARCCRAPGTGGHQLRALAGLRAGGGTPGSHGMALAHSPAMRLVTCSQGPAPRPTRHAHLCPAQRPPASAAPRAALIKGCPAATPTAAPPRCRALPPRCDAIGAPAHSCAAHRGPPTRAACPRHVHCLTWEPAPPAAAAGGSLVDVSQRALRGQGCRMSVLAGV